MKSSGGAYIPAFDYDRTGASDTAGTYIGPTLTGPTITGTIAGGPTITAPTITGPTMSNPVITGDATSGFIVSKTVAFVEDAVSTTSTGTIVIPAGATLIDIIVTSTVLWTKASARFTCGDAQAATGWFVSTNLNATDLLVGERLSAAGGVQAWGGLNGAYLVSATGRFGQATATIAGPYYASAGSVIGVCTVTPGAGAAGRTFMTVIYSVGQVVAPVLA